VVWLPRHGGDFGFSGGWRGFAIDLDLYPSDAVVFEVAGPCRLVIHILRALDYEAAGRRQAIEQAAAVEACADLSGTEATAVELGGESDGYFGAGRSKKRAAEQAVRGGDEKEAGAPVAKKARLQETDATRKGGRLHEKGAKEQRRQKKKKKEIPPGKVRARKPVVEEPGTKTARGTGAASKKKKKKKKRMIEEEKLYIEAISNPSDDANATTIEEADNDADASEEEVFYVERVMGVRRRPGGKKEYLIKWEGYSPSENTWEPRGMLDADPGTYRRAPWVKAEDL
jgi:hypothetical protein